MFKQRIVTALFLLFLVTIAVLKLPFDWYIGCLAIIMIYAAWEWSYLIGIKSIYGRLCYVFLLSSLGYLPWLIPTVWILLTAIIIWLIITGWIMVFPKGIAVWNYSYFIPGIIGLIILFSCWVSLIGIRGGKQGILELLLLLLIVSSADMGAYIIGKLYGKHPLAPVLSPRKTKEGFYGGIIVALFVAILFSYIFKLEIFSSPLFGLLVIVIALMSVVGDLLESMAKRVQGVKDSGRIFPGHGGLLDRIDSLIAAAPFFALLTWLIR